MFSHCTAYGAVGFLVRDGASFNSFNSCKAIDCGAATRFYDTTEDGGAQYAGRHNRFNNCLFINSEYGLDFNSYDVPSPVDSNVFMNCDFYGGEYLFKLDRENHANRMVNCIVNDFQHLSSGSVALDFGNSFTNYFGNSFSTPNGTDHVPGDPMFVDAANGDLHLLDNSPCIDAATETDAPSTDFEGPARPMGNGVDLGAIDREYREAGRG